MQWFMLLYELVDWIVDAFSAFAETPDGKKRLDAIESKVASLTASEQTTAATNVRR
jgi:hypothetical protein